jgi:ABC-type multidrug transport system ATPase subunit
LRHFLLYFTAVRKFIAFVAQDDSLQVAATPREAVMSSAKLRLPRSTTDLQLEKLTNRINCMHEEEKQ